MLQDDENAPERLHAEQITSTLRYCMLLTGIRANNVPDQIEKGVLIDFIKRNYNLHTCEEIKLAFDMAMAGTLEIDDVKCYENFSVEYFGRIMGAYRSWAIGQADLTVNEDTGEVLNNPDEEDTFSDLWEMLCRDELQAFYKPYIAWATLYDWAVRTNRFTPTPGEKRRAYEEGRNELISDYITLKNANKATPDDKAILERLKCIDWRDDLSLSSKLITAGKSKSMRNYIDRIKAPDRKLDLFGAPLEEITDERARVRIAEEQHKQLLLINGQRPSFKCGYCKYFFKQDAAGTYFKCEKASVTNGLATDWRVNWMACGIFEARKK